MISFPLGGHEFLPTRNTNQVVSYEKKRNPRTTATCFVCEHEKTVYTRDSTYNNIFDEEQEALPVRPIKRFACSL